MFKKALMILVLALGGTVACMLVGQTKAYACSNGACGYFKDGNDSAWCNVLPDPTIRSYYSSNNCWLNSGGGNGHSLLYGDADVNSFLNDMWTYLNAPGGNGGYNNNAEAGAAFIIDDMLGRDYHNGDTGKGISDARAQFTNWSNIIKALGANQCATNSGQMTCPGKSFGINWKYTPPYFCSSPVMTSGYDPFGAFDTPLYFTGPATCDHDWRASVPEIVFYWNNGASSFHIGSQCGNVQSRANTLPRLNSTPVGTITIDCDSSSGTAELVVKLTFADADGSTKGYIKTTRPSTGQTFSTAPAASPQQFTLNASWYDPGGGQTVALWVTDVGALGGGDKQVKTAVTPSCVSLNCGSAVPTPSPLDPAMTFSLRVTATANGAAGNGTLQITIPGVLNGTQSQSVTPNGTTYTATFNNIGPTGKTGVFAVNWTLTAGGQTQSCSGTIPVANMPYLNVYGGDIAVGASPTYSSGASVCALNTAAGAFSWNNHGTNFSGAGAQYAVEALAQIEDVASALNSSNSTPAGLSFANTFTPADLSKLDPSQGLFGGSFGAATSDCDFTTNIGVSPSLGDKTIGGMPIGLGTSPVTYVTNGDVYINGNITYAGTGGWASVGQIPSFKLVVVGGNIYIDHSVTQLDGLYVAEPSDGNGGHIYTCATGMGDAVDLSAAGSYARCNTQLVVNGAFVAKQVQFGRTYGTVGNAKPTDTGKVGDNDDAEVFNYTPELWLPRSNAPPSTGYATITGLPPVL